MAGLCRAVRTNVRDPAGVEGRLLVLLLVTNDPEPVVVEPLAAHAHLSATRRQRQHRWGRISTSSRRVRSRPGLARRSRADLRWRRTRDPGEQQQAQKRKPPSEPSSSHVRPRIFLRVVNRLEASFVPRTPYRAEPLNRLHITPRPARCSNLELFTASAIPDDDRLARPFR